MEDDMMKEEKNTMGKVYLVGAGPGDGGLITVKGADLIRSADLVVYDRLVGREVMDLIPAETPVIDVGKNAGHHPVPQQEINEILLAHAKAGETVVRLKGGDPFVFGRGGEELELLAEQGIEFEVVPGITSSIAAPAYAGIPVTHRDYCSSLHIITGHARKGARLELDYEALVRLKGTLVFLMSVSSIGEIAAGLMGAGMDPGMPCAVIENGTMARQRKVLSALSDLAAEAKRQEVKSPATILVGRVAALSDRFDWISGRPLLGQKILVTQPQAKASRLAGGLRQLGAEAVLYPCIRTRPIRPLNIPAGLAADGRVLGKDAESRTGCGKAEGRIAAGDAHDRPATQDAGVLDFDTLVFTSAEGVRSYCGWLLECGEDMRVLAGKKLACIGSATAAALREYGLAADFVPSVYSGQVLGEEMISSGFVSPASRVLLLRTRIASHDVTDALAAAGVPFADIPVYETEILKQDPLDMEQVDMVSFTSRSCVTGFIQSQGREDFHGVKALCIGEKTAEEAARYGFDCIVADVATIEGMLSKARDPEAGDGLFASGEETEKRSVSAEDSPAGPQRVGGNPHIVRGSPEKDVIR